MSILRSSILTLTDLDTDIRNFVCSYSLFLFYNRSHIPGFLVFRPEPKDQVICDVEFTDLYVAPYRC